MAFNKIDLENIKSKILISEELDKKTKVIKKGKDFWCCCPFHNEKSPSFYVSPIKKIFHCFGCGESGDVLSFIMKYENISFKEIIIEK